jgi:cytochrome c-type biogenesis protein CcsB
VCVANKPFKRAVGLDPERKFFTTAELASCKGITDLLNAHDRARQRDSAYQATRNERFAMDAYGAASRIAALAGGEPLPMIPAGENKPFLKVGLGGAEPGGERVRDAMREFGRAYTSGGDLNAAADAWRASLDAAGRLAGGEQRRVGLEYFYDRHDPWGKTAYLYGLSVVLLGLSRLMWKKPLVIAGLLVGAGGVVEHLLGIGLRMTILERAPVSNTFESLLWMGLVGIAISSVAQFVNRTSYYLFAGLCAALLSVLFAGLVPLEDRTNSLPAVLRSNYWLIVHVLTIVASYGVLAVASVLGHVYLAREVLLRSRHDTARAGAPGKSHAVIVQTYRCIQIGVLLLTAGTILGGVWAADSWGRFWGWDPKETWALISILVYFAVLHARYINWLRDFGLAASAVLGFVVIVWTFYGVNYVMASGLHSYGFGAGGELWVGLWAAAEIIFLIACKIRHLRGAPRLPPAVGESPSHPMVQTEPGRT